MYVYLLEDALTEYSYEATLAGLGYSLGITTTGLQVKAITDISTEMSIIMLSA